MLDDDVTIGGADDLIGAGRRLKATGDKGPDSVLGALRRELNAGSKPLRKKAQARIREALPHRGGLSVWVGSLPSTSVTVQQDRASVKVKLAKRGHDLDAMNRTGTARHPVYGNRSVWAATDVPKGFYEDALEPEAKALAALVSEAIGRAVERAATKGL